MDVAAFIDELLENQNDLIVPGLGSFYRRPVEGYYSKEQHQFYPPSVQLQFDPELKDDNKLVDQIAADRHISAESARYFVDEFVGNILEQLGTESVTMGEMGTFSMRRNQLIFTATRSNKNNELYYGLEPVRLKRNQVYVQPEPEKPAVQVPVTEKTSAFTAALLRGEPMPDTSVEEYDGNESEPRKFGTWILVIALIILISGIGLICAYKFDPALFDKFSSQNEPPPLSEKKDKKIITDSERHAAPVPNTVSGSTRVVDTAATVKKPAIIAGKAETPVAAADTFGLVISTFKTLNGATRELDRYIHKGLKVEIHKSPKDNKRYQIDVASYYNIDSAKAHLQAFKERLKEPEIFIETYPYKKQ